MAKKFSKKSIAIGAVTLLVFAGAAANIWINRDQIAASIDRKLHPAKYMEFLQKGREAAAQNKLDEALKQFQAAEQLRPDNDEVYGCIGDIYNKLKQPEKAIQPYTVSITLNPRNARSYLGRAQCYAAMKDHDHAIADYDQGFKIDPGIHELLTGKCAMLLNQGKDVEALIAAMGANDKLKADWTRKVVNNSAKIVIARQNASLEAGPRNQAALVTLGFAYSSQEQYGKAVDAYNRALKVNVLDHKMLSAIHTMRARAYMDMGENRKAMDDVKQALTLSASNTEALDLRQKLEALGQD